MPSTRPQAAFEAISPTLNVHQLVEETPNFEWAVRINCDMIELHGVEQFERLLLVHVILGGKPLVIDNYQSKLDSWTFSVQWLKDNWGKKIFDARDLTADKNVPLTMSHYLKHMSLLANQWDERNFKDKTRQRMYLKDIDCPPMWADKVRSHIPLGMFYMNESTGDVDASNAMDGTDLNGAGDRRARSVAKAGDLMSSLPSEMRAENLMCYIGHEGTYTPAHREMCASLGQNIMVEASKATVEDGKLTQPGSSIWFMTETKEREVVSEYWLSRLGHDIEVEKHFAQVNAWKQAPFKVYVVEQQPGDLILIPPLAPHQVWNRGTRTIKVAWNRTTVETLEMAMEEALPKARMVCRDEQYKNKAIIYYTLQKYSGLLRTIGNQRQAGAPSKETDVKARQLQKDFKRLQNLYTKIMLTEHFDSNKPEKHVELVPYDGNITCSYCRCNIFNRFLTCKNCVIKDPDGGDDATYDVCMDCYAMGRSCACISKLSWVEQWNWNELTGNHDTYRRQIIESEGKVDAKSPRSLKTELNLMDGRRTLAHICQIELTRRPFQEAPKGRIETNAGGVDDEDEEIDAVDENGFKKKKKKVRRSEKYIREHGRCHIDCYWEPKWKQAQCSKCDKNYCYGNLYRAYDMMPQDVMADPKWKCPSCRKICGCRNCRHKPGFKQYTPKGMLLGHNTKAVADARSVESLVDFSFSNIAWIQKAGDDHEEDTQRLRRRLKEAEAAKAKEPQLGEENYVDGVEPIQEDIEGRLMQLAEQEGIPIDPALGMMQQHDNFDADVDGEFTIVEHPEGDNELFAPLDQAEIDPRYFVPEGGVIWDNEHAYIDTGAITYVYPDLNPTVQLPPAPTDGYTPALVPGYEPAMPPETDGKIEMVDRKRKRKLEDEDKPWKSHKASAKPKAKKRKSLVVKLAVNRERLAELDQSMNSIQLATQENVPPVVVGSDLQALNIERQAPALHQPPRRNRDEAPEAEIAVAENDDDFTPGRRRRPVPDATAQDELGADAPRRTTRMQAVTYAEIEEDDDEFDEVVVSKPATSKLATMEMAVKDARSTAPTRITTDQSPMVKWPAANSTSSATPKSAVQRKTASSNQPAMQFTPLNASSTKKAMSSQAQVVRLDSETSTGSSPSLSDQPDPAPKPVHSEIQANRRAKMAAIEGTIDIDVSDENDDDDESSRVATPNGNARLQSSEETSETSSSEDEVPPAVAVKTLQHKPVGGKAPKFSLMKTAPVRSTIPEVTPAPNAPAVKKVSAADWGDSDSDEDPRAVRSVITANARNPAAHGTVHANRNNHHPFVQQAPKRGRGRPPNPR